MPFSHPDFVQIYRAYDHGYFPDIAYCLWIAHLGNRYIAFKEQKWERSIARDIARDIKESSEGMRVVITYCDPTIDINTGADVRTIKSIFEDEGIPMECSINNRELYAAAIHTALGEEAEPGIPKLQIYDKGCPYLVKTLPQQRFNPKRPMAMDDNKHDHAAVALAYFLISSGSMDKKTVHNAKKSPKWMRPKKDSNRRFILGSESVRNLY